MLLDIYTDINLVYLASSTVLDTNILNKVSLAVCHYKIMNSYFQNNIMNHVILIRLFLELLEM